MCPDNLTGPVLITGLNQDMSAHMCEIKVKRRLYNHCLLTKWVFIDSDKTLVLSNPTRLIVVSPA